MKKVLLFVFLFGVYLFPIQTRAQNFLLAKHAVFKITASKSSSVFAMPWQISFSEISGSGFYIGNGRIMTSAHVVDGAMVIVIENPNIGKMSGKIEFISKEADLAIIKVSDLSKLSSVPSLEFGNELSSQDEIFSVGYTSGRDFISINSGLYLGAVVEKYSFKGFPLLMGLTSIPLNRGDSGGPVINSAGKVCGVSMQYNGSMQANGAITPLAIIQQFLSDIADGQADGIPFVYGITWQSLSRHIRNAYGLKDDVHGLYISYVEEILAGRFKEGDVIISVDGYTVDDDGYVSFGQGEKVFFSHVVNLKMIGNDVEFIVWREGKKERVFVSFQNKANTLVINNKYKPAYTIFGGMVFIPLAMDYIRDIDPKNGGIVAKKGLEHFNRGKHFPEEELVFLSGIITDEDNKDYSGFQETIVLEVNGERPNNLKHFHELLFAKTVGAVKIRVKGINKNEGNIFLDIGLAKAINARIEKALQLKNLSLIL